MMIVLVRYPIINEIKWTHFNHLTSSNVELSEFSNDDRIACLETYLPFLMGVHHNFYEDHFTDNFVSFMMMIIFCELRGWSIRKSELSH